MSGKLFGKNENKPKKELDGHFAAFLSEYPPSENLVKPDAKITDKYEAILPEMIEFWKQYGFGNYGSGLVKIINPDTFETVSGVNPAVDIPLMVSAFGDIFIYRHIPNQNLKAVGILNVHYRNREFFIIGDDCIEQFFGGVNRELPIMRTALFEEAVAKCGNPAPNEIFFFVPMLAMGGAETIGFIDKGDMFVHYHILSEVQGHEFSAQY